MHRAVQVASISMLVLLTGCSSLNPFAKPPPDAPAALAAFTPGMSPKTVWSYSIGKAENGFFSPAFAAESVFTAAADGALARVEAASGKLQWRINAGTKLTAGVGSDGETVAVVGTKGVLMAFDANGKLRWKEQLGSNVLTTPAVGDGLVVIRGSDNRIIAFDAQTGSRRWVALRTTPPLILHGGPGVVIDSGTVYVAQPGGKLLALNGLNGGPRWESVVAESRGATELERISDLVGRPVVTTNEVCATSFQGRLACFDPINGTTRWSKELSSQVGPTVDERFVFAVDTRSAVSGFSRDSGQNVWRNEKMLFRQLSTPVSLGRAVIVGDFKGFLHFLSREDGALLARVATDGSAILGTPVVSDARAIFQTQAGTVVAVATD
jgi:outer membrane protein assembly factor BamB